MNWFGKILDLPKEFLNESEGPGGGVLQVIIEWQELNLVQIDYNKLNNVRGTATRVYVSGIHA
jgi:hypothetical protein